MKIVLNVLFACLLLCYPFMVFFGFKYFEPRVVSLALIVILLLRFVFLSKKTKDISLLSTRLSLLAGFLILIAVQIFNKGIFIKLYPFFMSAIFFFSFAYSLKHKPSMAERFARMQHKKLPAKATRYLRKVTLLWCVFFVLNGTIALYTTFFTPIEVWTFYNGFLSYILMGVLFILELIFRQWKMRSK